MKKHLILIPSVQDIRQTCDRDLLIGILIVDFFFVFADLFVNGAAFWGIADFQASTERRFSLKDEASYASIFLVYKWIFIAAVMLMIAKVNRNGTYLVLATLFALLFVIDLFQVHETFGEMIARQYGIEAAFGLRAQDFGEMAVMAVLGLPCILGFMIALSAKELAVRKDASTIIVLFGLLMVFGVGLDMMPTPFEGTLGQLFDYAVSTIEDAGELMVGTIILAFTWGRFGEWREMRDIAEGDSGRPPVHSSQA
jgi:hypothetical protein